jgi:hypothetical protein
MVSLQCIAGVINAGFWAIGLGIIALIVSSVMYYNLMVVSAILIPLAYITGYIICGLVSEMYGLDQKRIRDRDGLAYEDIQGRI